MMVWSFILRFVFLSPTTISTSKRMVLVFVVGTILGACATNPEPSNTQHITPSGSHAENPHKHKGFEETVEYFGTEEIYTLSAGISGITERYIEEVAPQKLAIDALGGLSAIDPSIDVILQNGQKNDHDNLLLQMAQFNHSAFERGTIDKIDVFSLPKSIEPRIWAEFISNVVNIAKDHSPILNKTNSDKVLESLFDGMLVGLDVFSRYAGPIEADHNRARREGFGGIGVHFSDEKTILGIGKKGFPITSVTTGTPAADAGLVPGDRIISISGHNVSGYKMQKLAAMLRGPVGSKIAIGILREYGGKTPIIFNLTRAHIIPETVTATVNNNILNIRINSFNRLTAGEVRDSISAVNDKIESGAISGIVMDLRDNPGGLLMQSVNVADLFLTKGDIIATNGRHQDSIHKYHAGGIDIARNLPLAILINGDSASAAEVLAGALQDQGRAVVIGTTSYGKGSVQTVLGLPNSGEITLTWSRLITPSGYAIHQLGILPNVCASEGTALPSENQMDENETLLRQWREIGLNFGEKRQILRKSCRDTAKKVDESRLRILARNVIANHKLYAKAIEMSLPTDSARKVD